SYRSHSRFPCLIWYYFNYVRDRRYSCLFERCQTAEFPHERGPCRDLSPPRRLRAGGALTWDSPADRGVFSGEGKMLLLLMVLMLSADAGCSASL
ncbi:hypothetical protein XENOCAPTIV_019167, partial [Xenoophorus captivus]